MPLFQARTRLDVPAEVLYAWHARDGAFERLVPPWERFVVHERSPGLGDGARTVFDIRKGPFAVRWEAVHERHVPDRQFVDVQARGPFRKWEHTHGFEPEDGGCVLSDTVDWRLPALLAPGGPYVRRQLERTFAFRHRRTRHDLERHASYGQRRLRIALTGASGFVGSKLAAFLRAGGHEVLTLVRDRPSGRQEVAWDVRRGSIDAARLEGLDAVVHMAGATIGQRWTPAARKEILESREKGTALIARALAGLDAPPPVLLSFSAVGFYGDRGDELLPETAPAGTGFLAEVATAWEAAAEPARAAGLRVVHPRMGIVLEPDGGFLGGVLPLFRCGLGGRVGSGAQYVPWIAADDALGAVLHAIVTPGVRGPMNTCAPSPATNAELAKALGRALRRPAVLPAPAFGVRLLLGEMGREVVLGGQRAVPTVLEQTGFRFALPSLDDALRFVLGTWRTAEP